jgi:hypothetical protein
MNLDHYYDNYQCHLFRDRMNVTCSNKESRFVPNVFFELQFSKEIQFVTDINFYERHSTQGPKHYNLLR